MQKTRPQSHSSEKVTQVRSEPAEPVLRLAESEILKPSHRILCYGCGRGADVSWLKRRKFKVQGYDPHPPFGYTDVPSGKFDFVLLVYLMGRLKNDDSRRAVLSKAYGLVRPGGHLVVATRSWMRLAALAGGDSRQDGIGYLARLLDGCGFSSFEAPELDTEGPSMCVLGRKPGCHRPKKPVEWVDAPAALESLCLRLRKEPMIGLDVETTLEEPRELCTVQLASAGGTWIVDALALRDFEPLKRLMEDGEVEKVIHNASFEEQMLAKHGIRIRNVFDTLPASRKKYRKKEVDGGHKLVEVCERELEVYLDKSLQTSDWKQRPLSQAQMDYAALDAEVLIDLHRVFNPPPPPQNLDLFAGL